MPHVRQSDLLPMENSVPPQQPGLAKELLRSFMCAATIAGTWILIYVFVGVTTISAILAAILAGLIRVLFSYMRLD